MTPETQQRLAAWRSEGERLASEYRRRRAEHTRELAAIVQSAGNAAAVARGLGITRQALHEKLRKVER